MNRREQFRKIWAILGLGILATAATGAARADVGDGEGLCRRPFAARPVEPVANPVHNKDGIRAGSARHRNPLLDELAFPPGRFAPAGSRMGELRRMLLEPIRRPEVPDVRIGEGSSFEERLRLVADYPLRQLVAKPGHRVLRELHDVHSIRDDFRAGQYRPRSRTEAAKLMINLVTEPGTGRLLWVDAWEGHHRILGFILGGARTVSDIPREELRIFVNGLDPGGETQGHPYEIPAAGSDLASGSRWPEVVDGQGRRAPYYPKEDSPRSVVAHRALSNWETGSRETLGDVAEHMEIADPLRIGVVLHAEPLVPELEDVLEWDRRGFDEIVLVPEAAPRSAVDHHLLRAQVLALNIRLSLMPDTRVRLNLYQGLDSAEFMERHDIRQGEFPRFPKGYPTFLHRIRQIYGTTHDVVVVSPSPSSGPEQP